MTETIIGVVLVPCVMLILFWADTRRRSHKQHTENQVRLTAIETRLEPIWDWWNERRNGGLK